MGYLWIFIQQPDFHIKTSFKKREGVSKGHFDIEGWGTHDEACTGDKIVCYKMDIEHCSYEMKIEFWNEHDGKM
jgi:hypothetical protein